MRKLYIKTQIQKPIKKYLLIIIKGEIIEDVQEYQLEKETIMVISFQIRKYVVITYNICCHLLLVFLKIL